MIPYLSITFVLLLFFVELMIFGCFKSMFFIAAGDDPVAMMQYSNWMIIFFFCLSITISLSADWKLAFPFIMLTFLLFAKDEIPELKFETMLSFQFFIFSILIFGLVKKAKH